MKNGHIRGMEKAELRIIIASAGPVTIQIILETNCEYIYQYNNSNGYQKKLLQLLERMSEY